MGQHLVTATAIIAALVLLITLIGCITIVSIRSNDQSARVKISCINSGQSWIYDKNGWGTCVPRNEAK